MVDVGSVIEDGVCCGVPLLCKAPTSVVTGLVAGSGNTRCPFHAVHENGGGVPTSFHTAVSTIVGSLPSSTDHVSGYCNCGLVLSLPVCVDWCTESAGRR